MNWNLLFFINSVLLGVGLAMDAFCVSLADGLHEPGMGKTKRCKIAGTFAGFQAIMPIIGWFCVHTISRYFRIFEKFVPWIALLLLLIIGGEMLLDGIRKEPENTVSDTGSKTLVLQGIATSIDALSVGFTIAQYNAVMAVTSAAIIAVVTFIICIAGLLIGRKFSTRLSDKANILGGILLIFIGIEIFIKGIF